MALNNPIHILFLTKWYPTAADPMLGLFVKKHAQAATAAGYRVTVVYLTQLQHPEGKRKEFNNEGLLTEYIYYLNGGSGIGQIFQQMRTWEMAMRKVLRRQGKPDLIHAHILTRQAFLGWWLGLGWHIPFIVTEHWSRYYPENHQFSGAFRKHLTRWIIKRAAAVTVVSQRLAHAMHHQKLDFEPFILPNVVDTNLFRPSIQKSSSRTIVSITCFEEKSKNLNLLLQAFKKLHQFHPEVKLQLIGEGADREWTGQRAELLGLQHAVIFSGMMQGQALADALSRAACLAISSNYETFAIVAFEALSCGIPVVATDVADLSLHIKSEWGEIVPPGNEAALSEKLLRVLQNPVWPQKDMHQYVNANFSEKVVAQIMDQLYTNSLKAKR